MTSREQQPMESLFAAARRDNPAPQVKVRVLARMIELSQEEPSRVRVLPFVVPILLATAALAVFWVRSETQVPGPIVAEPVTAASGSAPPSAVSAATSVNTPTVVTSAPPPTVRAAPKRPLPPSLSQEVESLDRVRTALDVHDPERALVLLEAYRRSGGARLGAEAELLRIEALSRSGKTEQASQLAENFVRIHPGNPLVDRARAFIGSNPE